MDGYPPGSVTTGAPGGADGIDASVLDVEGIRVRVRKHLEAFLDRQASALDGVGEELRPLLEPLVDLTAGGKRLRPAFCYWGWRGASERDPRDDEAVVAAATALELLQACALLHDDVMDRSDLRRGLPAAHRRLAAMHRGNGWLGTPERFGEAAAILLGDLCLSWTDEAFFASGLTVEQLIRAKPLLDVMRTEVMAGQYLDLVEQVRGDASADRVVRVMRYKSAKYTVERPLQLGGALGGASPELLAAYTAYGLPLGEAFQLRDDVLGVFGDPAETGKPAGDDLREGKRTLLVVLALQQVAPPEAARMRRLLGDPSLDADGVRELQEVLVRAGALDAVERRIAALTAQARAALAFPGVDEAAVDVLDSLALAATARTR